MADCGGVVAFLLGLGFGKLGGRKGVITEPETDAGDEREDEDTMILRKAEVLIP